MRFRLPALLVPIVFPTASLYGQTLQLETITDASPRVEVFGDGDVKGAIGQPDAATVASGSLGMRYLDGTFIVTGKINMAGTTKTATRSFGATLLSPATGGPLNAGLVDLRLPHLLSTATCHPNRRNHADTAAAAGTATTAPRSLWRSVLCTFGFHAYGSIATTRWATNVDANGVVTDSADVPFWGVGIGPSVTFFDGQIGGDSPKSVSMVLDIGLATRHLRGDLFSQDSLRQALLGTTRRNYYGLELGLGLQFGNVRAGFNYYFLDGNLGGLSHGQVVAGVSVQANLIGGKIQDGSNPPPPESH